MSANRHHPHRSVAVTVIRNIHIFLVCVVIGKHVWRLNNKNKPLHFIQFIHKPPNIIRSKLNVRENNPGKYSV